jgi:dTDP-4-dehydrorhamnose reductase
VDQPLVAARWCHQARSRFVYFSTSYVFDGSNGPYAEDAAPNPTNVYGRAKLKAEQAIADATNGAALIPRVIYVYGAEAQQKNFACQIWRAMESGKPLTVPSDQEGNPTFAGDIGRWTIELLEKNATGIWHIAGPDPKCDKAEWARQLAAAFQAAGVQPHRDFAITGVATDQAKQRAPRPLHAGLLTPRVATLKTRPTDLKAVIADMVHSAARPA